MRYFDAIHPEFLQSCKEAADSFKSYCAYLYLQRRQQMENLVMSPCRASIYAHLHYHDDYVLVEGDLPERVRNLAAQDPTHKNFGLSYNDLWQLTFHEFREIETAVKAIVDRDAKQMGALQREVDQLRRSQEQMQSILQIAQLRNQ
jgi:hypothetical protein